jgi:hypothetical protein
VWPGPPPGPAAGGGPRDHNVESGLSQGDLVHG